MNKKILWLMTIAWLTACIPNNDTTVNPEPTYQQQSYPVPLVTQSIELPAQTQRASPLFEELQIVSAQNVDALKIRYQLQKGNAAYDLAWSPDSYRIAFVSNLGLFVYDLASNNEWQLVDTNSVDSRSKVVFSPDGKLVATVIVGLAVRLFNAETGELFRTFIDEEVESLDFNPNGRDLILTSGRELIAWDIETDVLSRTFLIPNDSRRLRQVAFTPDGKYIATSTTGGGLLVLDAFSGEVVFQTTVNLFLARQMVFNPSSSMLAIGDSTMSGLQLWSIDDQQLIFGVNTQAVVNGISFTSDGKVVASAGGAPNTIEFWLIENKERIASIEFANQEFDNDFVEDISFSPDGRFFASAGGDGNGVVIWAIP